MFIFGMIVGAVVMLAICIYGEKAKAKLESIATDAVPKE